MAKCRKIQIIFRQFAHPRMIYFQIEKQILQDAWGSCFVSDTPASVLIC